MATSDEIQTEIGNLIQDVIHASKLFPRQRSSPIRLNIDTLAGLSYQHGLLTPHLTSLVHLVTAPSHLDQASLGTLARNLYPASVVPEGLVIQVIAALGYGEHKVPLAVQGVLVRWLIMVSHVVEGGGAVLGRGYGVLFGLLDTGVLRAGLCHLLAIITRRRHVRPFRIQYLMDLSLRQGSDPSIIGLLRVYKDYYPEIIVGAAIKGRASAFKHPDLAWRARLDEIQEEYSRTHSATTTTTTGDPSQIQNGFKARRALGTARSSARPVIPAIHTSHATEISVTLEEIDSATRFVGALEKITLPDQLVAILADPLLQKLLLLRPDAAAYRRIAEWVRSMARDVEEDPGDHVMLADMLGVLWEYVRATKHFPPAFMTFLTGFLLRWDGHASREAVLGILAFMPLQEWGKLHSTVLVMMENRLITQSHNQHQAQQTLLSFYTSLLRYWSTLFLAAEKPLASSAAAITALITHANTLAATLSQTAPVASSVAASLVILDFFEQSAVCCAIAGLKEHIRIMLPDSALVYSFMFSASPAVLSRLCAVLCVYKKALELAVLLRRDGSQLVNSSSYDKSYVNLFNGYLMDLVNCLWRIRAFSRSDPNAQGCLVPPELVQSLDAYIKSLDGTFGIAMSFGLSLSPTLSGLSIAAFREIEERRVKEGNTVLRRHAGPVTAQSLEKLGTQGGVQMGFQEYRVMVLKYLEGRGVVGVPELMRNTMKILMTPRKPDSQVSQSSVGESPSVGRTQSQSQ